MSNSIVGAPAPPPIRSCIRKIPPEEGRVLLSLLVSTRNSNGRKCNIDFAWRSAVIHWNRWLISRSLPPDGTVEFAQRFFNEQSEIFSRYLSTSLPTTFPYRRIFCEIMEIKHSVMYLFSLDEGIELLNIIKRNLYVVDNRRNYLWPNIVAEFRDKMMALGRGPNYVTKAKIKHYFSGNYKRYRTYLSTGRPRYFPDEFKELFGEIFYNITLPETRRIVHKNKQYLAAQKRQLTIEGQMTSTTENSNDEDEEDDGDEEEEEAEEADDDDDDDDYEEEEEENMRDSRALIPINASRNNTHHNTRQTRLRLLCSASASTQPQHSTDSNHLSASSSSHVIMRQETSQHSHRHPRASHALIQQQQKQQQPEPPQKLRERRRRQLESPPLSATSNTRATRRHQPQQERQEQMHHHKPYQQLDNVQEQQSGQLLLKYGNEKQSKYRRRPLDDDEIVLVAESVVPDTTDEGTIYGNGVGNEEYSNSMVPIIISSSSPEPQCHSEDDREEEREDMVNRLLEANGSEYENAQQHQNGGYQDRTFKYPEPVRLPDPSRYVQQETRQLRNHQAKQNSQKNPRNKSCIVVLKIPPTAFQRNPPSDHQHHLLPPPSQSAADIPDYGDHGQSPGYHQLPYTPQTSEGMPDLRSSSGTSKSNGNRSSNSAVINGHINHANPLNTNLDRYTDSMQRPLTPESSPPRAPHDHNPHHNMQVVVLSDDNDEDNVPNNTRGPAHPLLEYAKLHESCEAEDPHQDSQSYEQGVLSACFGPDNNGFDPTGTAGLRMGPGVGPRMEPGAGGDTGSVYASRVFTSVLREYAPQERFALCSELVYKPYSANLHRTLQLVGQDADLIREVLNLVLFNMNYNGG
ncbi:uncharacterized protein SAPINGB_P004530 [Magnusiomyces paraingens]|uniref:Uncharacterized protein n=1 Tax=Magnusiomyces paraingens TaxID=2606893 RepID=A0A5E8C2F2_9ASCO|nr:uncharacterized protein SAPINGB_P004530 [Saprochaete ingens]VVT55305.1 unnamed protein product [Saprochaete ingens]